MRLTNIACFLALASLAGFLIGCNGDGSSTVPNDLATCPATVVMGGACQSDSRCAWDARRARSTRAGAPTPDSPTPTTTAEPDELCVGAEQECQ